MFSICYLVATQFGVLVGMFTQGKHFPCPSYAPCPVPLCLNMYIECITLHHSGVSPTYEDIVGCVPVHVFSRYTTYTYMYTYTYTCTYPRTYVCTCRQWYSSCDVRKLDSCVQTAAASASDSWLHTVGLRRPILHCALRAVTTSHRCECVRVCVVVSRLTLMCVNPHFMFPRDPLNIHVLVESLMFK